MSLKKQREFGIWNKTWETLVKNLRIVLNLFVFEIVAKGALCFVKFVRSEKQEKKVLNPGRHNKICHSCPFRRPKVAEFY